MAAICRSSQPLVGLRNNRSEIDEKYIQHVNKFYLNNYIPFNLYLIESDIISKSSGETSNFNFFR